MRTASPNVLYVPLGNASNCAFTKFLLNDVLPDAVTCCVVVISAIAPPVFLLKISTPAERFVREFNVGLSNLPKSQVPVNNNGNFVSLVQELISASVRIASSAQRVGDP